MIEITLLTVSQELVYSDKKVHSMFAEDLTADLLTELLLHLSHGGGQGYTERPLRLAYLLPGRFGHRGQRESFMQTSDAEARDLV